MGSKEITDLKPEWFKGTGSGTRLFAYSCALSGSEGRALPSSNGKVKGSSGMAGLMKELEKTKLDTCDNA